MPINEAYVTMVTSDSYAPGAGVLFRSLQSTGTKRPIWCLASRTLSPSTLETLHSIFNGVTEIDCIDSGDTSNLALLGRPELGQTFTKIHLWQLKQFDKVVFLDADTLILQNIDDLFEREELSACADVGWPDCFNSGVFVASPKEETFQALLKTAKEQGSFDGGDQGLLNAYFSDWSIGPSSRRIPFTYNLTINASYSYAPAYEHFKNQVRVVHFIGLLKPWTFYRLSDGSVVPRGNDSIGSSVNLEYVQLWWSIYDELAKSTSRSFQITAHSFDNSQSNDITKVYPSSNINNISNYQQNEIFSLSPESDFATYRIKWNADVESYFQSASNLKIEDSFTSNCSLNQFPSFRNDDLHHQNLNATIIKSKTYRTLGGDQKDETFYDGKYYTD